MSGEGGCAFCSRRWSLLRRLGIDMATVMFSRQSGQFVLCVPCWDAATVSERLAAHMWACDEADQRGHSKPGEREAIAKAVRAGRQTDRNSGLGGQPHIGDNVVCRFGPLAS